MRYSLNLMLSLLSLLLLSACGHLDASCPKPQYDLPPANMMQPRETPDMQDKMDKALQPIGSTTMQPKPNVTASNLIPANFG